MKRPYRYTVIDNGTGRVLYQTDTPPITDDLCQWIQTEDPNVSQWTQTRTAYIDTRYEAKLRLWRMYAKKNGLEQGYKPFAGTQVGIIQPILNF